MDQELRTLRDAYVSAFNRGALDELEALLDDHAVYRWVAWGKSHNGRAEVMALYRQGLEVYAGASRLSPVPGTDDQAIWWEPGEAHLQPRGLQRITATGGKILEIADEHDDDKVAALAQGLQPPR